MTLLERLEEAIDGNINLAWDVDGITAFVNAGSAAQACHALFVQANAELLAEVERLKMDNLLLREAITRLANPDVTTGYS